MLVKVNHLPASLSDETLREILEQYGPVAEIKRARLRPSSLGYADVRFSTAKGAQACLSSRPEYQGRFLWVGTSSPMKEKYDGRTVFLGGFSAKTTDRELEALLQKAGGEIEYVRRHDVYLHCRFATTAGALAATSSDLVLNGVKLQCNVKSSKHQEAPRKNGNGGSGRGKKQQPLQQQQQSAPPVMAGHGGSENRSIGGMSVPAASAAAAAAAAAGALGGAPGGGRNPLKAIKVKLVAGLSDEDVVELLERAFGPLQHYARVVDVAFVDFVDPAAGERAVAARSLNGLKLSLASSHTHRAVPPPRRALRGPLLPSTLPAPSEYRIPRLPSGRLPTLMVRDVPPSLSDAAVAGAIETAAGGTLAHFVRREPDFCMCEFVDDEGVIRRLHETCMWDMGYVLPLPGSWGEVRLMGTDSRARVQVPPPRSASSNFIVPAPLLLPPPAVHLNGAHSSATELLGFRFFSTTCAACGEENLLNVRFCSSCGAGFNNNNNNTNNNNTTTTTPTTNTTTSGLLPHVAAPFAVAAAEPFVPRGSVAVAAVTATNGARSSVMDFIASLGLAGFGYAENLALFGVVEVSRITADVLSVIGCAPVHSKKILAALR